MSHTVNVCVLARIRDVELITKAFHPDLEIIRIIRMN